MTILSVNKTREFSDGRSAPIFCCGWGLSIRIFCKEISMDKKTKKIVQAATIAAIYVVLTHPQQKMGALRPSENSLVLFTDRMVTNCPIQLHIVYHESGHLSSFTWGW